MTSDLSSMPHKGSKPFAKYAGVLRGLADDLPWRFWGLLFAMFVLAEISLCVSQFGLMSWGIDASGKVNFAFLLVPIALGALMLGLVPGFTIALAGGFALMFRSAWTPTSYFDMFLEDPLLSVVPIGIGGLIASLLIAIGVRFWPSNLDSSCPMHKRFRLPTIVLTIAGCFALAAAFSFGTRNGLQVFDAEGILSLNEAILAVLAESYDVELVVGEFVLNAVVLSIICIAGGFLDAYRQSGKWEPSLRLVFGRWLLLGVVMVFMVASTSSFCIETLRANERTFEELSSQLDYLQVQVLDHDRRITDLKKDEQQNFIEKGRATAEFIASDEGILSDSDRLAHLAETLSLESIAVTDEKGVVIADSEYGEDSLGYSFASNENTKPYLSLIDGGDPIVEEPRASIDPDGTVSEKLRVFCGVPRVDKPGIVQVSGTARQYEELLSAASIEHLADEYVADNEGIVAIEHDGVIITSNSALLQGKLVTDVLFDTNEELAEVAELGEPIRGFFEQASAMVVFAAREVEDYTLIAFVPLPATFSARTSTLLYNGVLFLAVLAVVFYLAWRVLRNVVVEPIKRTNSTLGLITEGDLNKRVDERNVVEFASLSMGINETVGALKDSIDEVEQRNAQELATAKAIQESALPREFPPFPDVDAFDIYASMKTAKEVGGDFYDFFLVDDDKLGFLIADVSGKGIPASLFMMTAKTQFRNYLESDMPIGEAVEAVNHQLCLGNDAGMFVTAFACILDYRSGKLQYVNAGHNPPLIYREGVWEWMRGVSGVPLGLFDGFSYKQYERQLEVEDMLYLYTDGVTEAMNATEELFGEGRLETCLYKYADMNPRSVCVGVRRAITDFTLDTDQSDDITMLSLKYGVPPERKAMMILPATDTQLVHVCNFIHEELHRRSAPKWALNPLDIAAEELFVNVCHYAYPDATPENPGEVRISFEYEANPPSLTVQISDDGVPYNPLAKPDAVTPDDIMEVPIGGLGILMAKRSVDEMTYERVGDSNVLTFRKGW